MEEVRGVLRSDQLDLALVDARLQHLAIGQRDVQGADREAWLIVDFSRDYRDTLTTAFAQFKACGNVGRTMRQSGDGSDRWLACLRTGGGPALVLLLACLLLTVTGCGTPAMTTTAPSTSYYGGTAPALGGPREPTSAPTGQTWIPLSSQSSTDILAAIKQAPFLAVVSSAPPGSDGYTDLSRLGTPVLVIAYRAPGDVSASALDFYEVPVLTAAGTATDTINAQLNAAHTALYVGSISGADPSDHWPAQLVSADQAAQVVVATFHTGLRSGSNIQLIYLAAYNTAAVETGQVYWDAGGGGPQNPIWLVPGADAHDYFVGTDGYAYSLAQLPLTQ